MHNESNPSGAEYEPADSGNLLHNLLLFGRICRVLGMDINPNRMMEVGKALEYVSLANKQDTYHALQAMMVTRQRDIRKFKEAFEIFWQRPTDGWTKINVQSPPQKHTRAKANIPPATEQQPATDEAFSQTLQDQITVLPTYSPQEILRHKDFADMSQTEIEQAWHLLSLLPDSLGLRRTRRFQPSASGKQFDMRQIMRHNMRFEGNVLYFPKRRPRHKPRPLVMISDISGSMERYTRILMRFMHLMSDNMYQVESFVFGTRLTRITHPIRQRSVDAALEDVGKTVKEWAGGTKTGESLRQFNRYWSRRVLGRGAVVLLITDGWDRGDIKLLEKEMTRLKRSCYRLIWLNPLLGVSGYEPLTRGAQTMLPSVDDFLPIHNLVSVEALLKELGKINWKRNKKL